MRAGLGARAADARTRLLYVNTPYVQQNDLPNFDRGKDFNFESIFSEKPFSGSAASPSPSADRRPHDPLLNPEPGRMLRLGVVQRTGFATSAHADLSRRPTVLDVLLRLDLAGPQLELDAAIQYNPDNTGSRLDAACATRPARSHRQRDLSPDPRLTEQMEIGCSGRCSGAAPIRRQRAAIRARAAAACTRSGGSTTA